MLHQSDVKWLAGLIAAIAMTLTAQSGLVADPWAHRLTLIGIVCSVIASYRITPPDSEKRA
jgi:hypothetical protein